MQKKTDGQVNFEAYRAYRKGIAYDDTPIPEWSELDPAIARGWEAGAAAVREVPRMSAAAMADQLVKLADVLAIPDRESSIRLSLRLIELEHGASYW